MVVSIPIKWARKKNIQKGDELDMLELPKSIVISKERLEAPSYATTLNITGFSTPLIWYYLTSLYRAGVHEITINCETTTTHDSQGRQVPVMKLLHEIAHRLIGMEVIKQGRRYCTIKQLSTIKPEELEQSMKRAFQSVISMAQEIEQGVAKDDKIMLEELASYADNQVNRLVDFCLRAISMRQEDSKKTLAYTYIVTAIEDIGDFFSYIAQLCAKRKASQRFRSVFKDMTTFLESLYHATYAFTNDKFIALHDQQQHLREHIQDVQIHGENADVMIGDLMYTITKRGMELLSYALILAHPFEENHL